MEVSPEQFAPIHAAIFAGRTNDAFKLYHAANGEKANLKIADYKNLLDMVAELKRAHPEKFSAEVLNRRTRNANRRAWLWWGFILLVGLWMLFLPHQSPGWLVWLLYGLGLGTFIRAMSSNKMSRWKSAYRSMRRWVRFLALILVGCVAFVIASVPFVLIVHPGSALDPEFDSLVSLAIRAAAIRRNSSYTSGNNSSVALLSPRRTDSKTSVMLLMDLVRHNKTWCLLSPLECILNRVWSVKQNDVAVYPSIPHTKAI